MASRTLVIGPDRAPRQLVRERRRGELPTLRSLTERDARRSSGRSIVHVDDFRTRLGEPVPAEMEGRGLL